MGERVMDAIVTADALYAARMAESSRLLLQAMRGGVAATSDLKWTELKRGGEFIASDTPTARAKAGDRVMARLVARDKRAEEQRTFRDPCPLCAVRGDIGCKHRPLAGPPVLVPYQPGSARRKCAA
jgi:hypothetical protein